MSIIFGATFFFETGEIAGSERKSLHSASLEKLAFLAYFWLLLSLLLPQVLFGKVSAAIDLHAKKYRIVWPDCQKNYSITILNTWAKYSSDTTY